MTPAVIAYENELTDEFSGAPAVTKPAPRHYCYYRRDWFYRLHHWFWHRILGKPIAWLHAKLRFGWRVVNRQAFKQVKKQGYFIYGNHTQNFFDAAMAKIISPRDAYVLVSPNNLNNPALGFLVRRLGGLPLFNDYAHTKKLITALDQLVADHKPVLIYPEAHIWPYYTGIRPFTAASFRYPVKYQVPAFCFTNTYQKKGKKLRIVTYVDGPFYPNPDLDPAAQRQDLRDRVYAQMVARSQNSNYTKIIYRKKESSHV